MEFVSITDIQHVAMYNSTVVMEAKNCTAEKAKHAMADCILTPEGSLQSFRFDLETDQFIHV
ncbi:MAG: hypothetical protein O9340_04365 [Cyclobacteriaceae bacterium]|nr:hypothetical protein [Cyclobacteriaceae bacterium]